MRHSLFIYLAFFLGLIACQQKSDGQQAEKIVDAFDYEKASLENVQAEENELQLTDIPEQSSLPNTVNFTGEYTLPAKGGLSFSVKLKQEGDSIMGSYCGYTETRSDCGMPSQGAPDCGIKGVIRNNVAYLLFRSCYVGRQGKATLKRKDQDILWNTHLYPESDGGPYFCAAPDSSLLLNNKQTYDGPAIFPAFEAKSGEFLVDPPTGKDRVIFTKTKVLHELGKQDFKTHLNPGTPVKILAEEGSYGYSRIGDEIFEVPAYKIAYEEHGQTWTGYIHYESMALHHFEDSRGNIFMLGLAEEEEKHDLVWKVKDKIGNYSILSTGVKALTENPGVYFPLFKYTVKTIPEFHMGEMSFIQLDLEYKKYQDRHRYSNLFSWDGEKISPVLPLLSKLRPYDIQAKSEGDRLMLSFQTEKDQFPKEPYINAKQTQILSYQERGIEKVYPTERLELAYLGDQNEFTFPDSLEQLAWYGVRTIGEEIVFEPITLSIAKEEAENEINGKWTKKKITTNSAETYDFILHGLPGIDDELYRKVIKLSAGEINPGKEKTFLGSEGDWRFTATGKMDEYGPVEFNLLLTGTRDGQLIEQNLHFSPFREYPVEFIWSGDLDGDQMPDFIINVDEKGITTDTRLYLSSFAEKGHLVGLAGSFYSNMPGC